MTLIVDLPADGPLVHVLAIGVGGYRHLPGGSEPVKHDTLDLGQLTGPPKSVDAFIDWVTRMQHPIATLGTVEMLVSPNTTYNESDRASVEIELPTLSHVVDAFDRWYKRCDSDPRNVAVFYFCGHGVERESQFLLLEDFGKSANRLLENSVDVGDLYLAMARCQAQTQYYFVDACREIPFQLLERLSGNAKKLIDAELVDDKRTDTALLFATSSGSKAYGESCKVTRFTQALVRALDGLGSRENGSHWVVNIPDLQRAVTRALRAGPDAPLQTPNMRHCVGDNPLHVLTSPPTVPVFIACDPSAAVPDASVALKCYRVPELTTPEPITDSSGWSFELPADLYHLTIGFPGGAYRGSEAHVYAFPPGYYLRVVVSS